MIHQELLRTAVGDRPHVLRHFVDTLAPQVLLAFSQVPALGGSGAQLPGERDPTLPVEAVDYTPEERARFAQGHDQSLSSHLFNGIFAGARIAEFLPPGKQLRDIDWHVWILGFVLHDYTKVHGIKIKAGHLDLIRGIVERLGDRLRFDAFLDTWKTYLDDIVFIAQNAQKRQGANLDLSGYDRLQLSIPRLDTLRLLASFADVLVHILRPADVAERDSRGRDTAQNLRTTLGLLFGVGQAPRLAYHQVTEVRGLLTNLINNALMRELETQGYEPYLFFTDGVVYITRHGEVATVDQEVLLKNLWHKLGATLAGTGSTGSTADVETMEIAEDAEPEGGIRITRSKDYLKVPPVLYEFLSFDQVLSLAREVALGIKAAKTAARLGAEVAEDRGIRITGKPAEKSKRYIELGQPFAEMHGLPTDVRVDRIAEFCAFLHRRLKDLFPESDWVRTLLLEVVDVRQQMPVERVYRNNGGTPTGWFYAAAHYLKSHRELDEAGVELLLQRIQAHVVNFLRQQTPSARPARDAAAWGSSYQGFIAAQGSDTAMPGRFERAFTDYVAATVVLDGAMLDPAAPTETRFTRELQQYTERKEANKVQCSLCSSGYEATEQTKSEVLFKPQQYSNKARLDTSTVVRGICPICALEMMLRQVQQGMRAGTSQDEKPITLFLYPTYFFTTETARVVFEFVNQLRDLNVPGLIFSHLGRQGFTLDALARFDTFIGDTGLDAPRTEWTLRKPRFSARDPASMLFFSVRPAMSNPTDTDAWVLPALYALALPLLLDIKVVASSSFVPVYNSGADFRATSILDAPHTFTRHVLRNDVLRVDELAGELWKLLRLYELNLDVFSKPKDLNWGMLNTVAKDVATDPYHVFGYYDRKQRSPEEGTKPKASKAKAKQTSADGGDGIPPYVVDRYIKIFHALGGAQDMGFIAKLVDAYAEFYRPENLKSAHAVLRPLATAIEVTVDSDPKIHRDDLTLLVSGALNDDQERIRSDPATKGFDPIAMNTSYGTYPERLALSRTKIAAFAELFLDEAFGRYCNGDRGMLRERANRLRSAARFYYLSRYARRDQVTEDSDEQ